MSIYTESTLKDQANYLQSLANEYGIKLEVIYKIAQILEEYWLNKDDSMMKSFTPETKPVMKDGKLENFMIRGFQCHCTCNVFHKPDDTKLNLYQCNACETQYEGEGNN